MSHEIRTPMNGMLGLLELLSLTPLDADQRATLETIRESSGSLLRIVDDILDFSKIEAGQLEIYPEVTSVGKILREVESLFSSAARNKGVLIRHSVDPEINPALLVDGLRLRQILCNFVGNSVKFTSSGSIEMAAELAGETDTVQQLRFVVRDTGIGISEANQQLLFQPFSQGDAVAARQAGGSGLGLTICRRLAHMMGGTVEMASELGQGTTMTLSLDLPIAPHGGATASRAEIDTPPAPLTPSGRREAPSQAQAQREGTLVLVVDDHPTNRLLLLRQMNTLGYAAESAEDGVQALEKWKSGRFGIIITDCAMPEMDGYELARSIRKMESESHAARIPILACTANALVKEAQQCIHAGMDDCMVKPVSLAGLLEKMDLWLPLPGGTEQSASTAGAPPRAPLDMALFRSNWGNDAVVIQELIDSFRRTNDQDIEQLRLACTQKDLGEVTRMAHRMLGASRVIGAQDLASACERMDLASRAGDWHTLFTTMKQCELETQRLYGCFDSQ